MCRFAVVTASRVSPHVLADPEHGHAVEAARIPDQDSLAFAEDGVVGGVPRDGESLSAPCHGQVRHHQGRKRPPQVGRGGEGQILMWPRAEPR